MDLLIALGLILVVCIKCFSDHKKALKLKEQQRVDKIQSDRFQEHYTNENVELMIDEKLSHLRMYSNEIWDELAPVFHNLPFCRDLTVDFINNMNTSVEIGLIKRMLLAKRGFMPINEARYVISRYDNIGLPSQKTQDSRLMRSIFKYAMIWCEQELHIHKIPVDLVATLIPPFKYAQREMSILFREYRDPTITGALQDDICNLYWCSQWDGSETNTHYLKDGLIYATSVSWWEHKFLDEALESRIRRLTEDGDGRVHLETTIYKLLSGMPYEPYSKNEKLPDSVMIDIVLAGYGKISRNASYWGYPAQLSGVSTAEECRAYAKTIQNILNTTGTELLLCADKDVYVWCGSRGSVYGSCNLQDIA